MSREPEKKEQENIFSIKGTIKHLKIEGGFYGIIGKDGNHYKPVNLPQEFQKDGLNVLIEAKKRPGMISFHMWGTHVEIISIIKI